MKNRSIRFEFLGRGGGFDGGYEQPFAQPFDNYVPSGMVGRPPFARPPRGFPGPMQRGKRERIELDFNSFG